MEKKDLKKYKLPDAPGVYFFLGKRKEILYIGKATSLKHRTKSYFDPDILEKRSALIAQMVEEASTLEWTVTDSVLEAILLETNLIRSHKPHYNTLAKDDKSYNHVVITRDEYPQVLVVRGKDLIGTTERYQKIYGPFPNGGEFKEALKILRRLFQFYQVAVPEENSKNKFLKGKIDFNRQIGLYPQDCTKEEYVRTIRHIQLFFEGKKKEIIKDLEKEMFKAAKAERFEDAQILKKRIFGLQHIHDIALIKDERRGYSDDRVVRIEAYDVAHHQGDDMVGVMTVMEGDFPQKNDYRMFKINGFTKANDPGALKELLSRRLGHPEWQYPFCIVVDGSVAQKNAAQAVLKKLEMHIPIVCVVKDEHHRPKKIVGPATIVRKYKEAILLANQEAHRFAITFHRKRRNKGFLPK